MTALRSRRWSVSFADLCLLLLGFFVILHARAGQGARVAAEMRAQFGGSEARGGDTFAAQALFQPGEAVFRPGADRGFVVAGATAARGGGRVRVESAGADRAALRFDAWELAAARAAAVARALRAGGLPEARIDIALAPTDARPSGQTIRVLRY